MGMGISEQELRADMSRRVDDTERNQQQAAIILERLTNRLDEHDRRITALEEAPTVGRGLTLQTLSTIGLFLAMAVTLVAPHVSFH